MSDKIHTKQLCLIGAGLPRTGTLSLMYALEILLPGQCYHGMKAVQNEKEWCQIMRGDYSDEEYRKFILSRGYVAGLDAPFCFEYERNIKIFPEAKVVLTTRDSHAWALSMDNTVLIPMSFWYLPTFLFSNVFRDYLTMWTPDDNLRVWSKDLYAACGENPKIMKGLNACSSGRGAEYFDSWIKEVESNVPEDKLLKFNVSEGWAPLCHHLGLPIPDVPFPNVNSTQEISPYLYRNRRRGWLLLYEFVTIPLCLYGVYRLIRK